MSRIPVVDEEVAELPGVLLGDGCLSEFFSNRRRILETAFTGHSSEYEYYRDFLKPVIEARFPIKGRLLSRGDNTTRLHFRSVRLARYFLSLGVPLGKKIDASIPKAIVERGYFLAFVRGFYHAEGSVYRRYSRPYANHARTYDNELVVQFRCKLKTLMLEMHTGLIESGLNPTRLTMKDGVCTFRFTHQSQIERFVKMVGPRYKIPGHMSARL